MALSTVFFDLGETLVRANPRGWLAGAKEILAEFKLQGLRLGIISNTGGLSTRAEILDLLPADFDLGAFEGPLVLFSSEVGIAKPDPAIFKLAVDRSDQSAEQTIYISENIVETLVAQFAGMRSIRIQPPPGNDLSTLFARILEYETAIS